MRARRPEHLTLAALLIAGAALRVWLTVQWRPALVGLPDSAGFIQAADTGVLEVPLRPAGYPIFLGALRLVSDGLLWIVSVQHVLGLVTAVLLYAAVVRLGLPRWAGVAGAAVVALHGSWIFLEHAVLAESLFVAWVALALWLAAHEGPAWLAGAGAALAAAAAVRTTGVVLVPVLVGFALWRSGWRPRLVAGAAAGAGAVVVLAGYLLAAHATFGSYAFARNDAYQSYGRVATFVDCRQFTPPRGSEPLCPAIDARQRLGHDWWLYSNESPAVGAFGHPASKTATREQLSAMNAFVRAAVLQQPRAYLRTVARDLVRLVKPSFPLNPTPGIGNSTAGYQPGQLDEALQDSFGERLTNAAAGGYEPHHGDMGALEDYAAVTRLTGAAMAVLLLLAAAAPFALAGPARRGAALLSASAYALLVFPVLTSSYDWRYVVPVLPLLAAAAAAGVAGLVARRRA